MRFWEAMKAIEEGTKVRIHGWPKGDYIYVDGDVIRDETGWICFGIQNYIWDKWEIYQERKDTYTFEEIIPMLKQGRKFKRKGFDYVISVADLNSDIIMQRDGANPYRSRWTTNIEDFEANDWIEVRD